MKIGFVSLGCPKNLVDGEVMLGMARDAGHTITADATDADAPDASVPDANAPDASATDANAIDANATDANATDATATDSGLVSAGGPGTCGALEQTFTPIASPHVADCSWVDYPTNPPSSGPHYPIWSAFRVYDAPLPRGYWVHDLEHGGVVVTYHCPAGCDAEVAAARAWFAQTPDDPICPDTGTVRARVTLTPDPHLDVRWAASAWGVTLRADCFDAATFTAFYLAHRGQAPEQVCAEGIDFSAPDGGVLTAAACGEVPPDAGPALDAGAD